MISFVNEGLLSQLILMEDTGKNEIILKVLCEYNEIILFCLFWFTEIFKIGDVQVES